MADDLLDYWVGLIKTIFPANAWIASRFSNNGHLIQIDWNLENDPTRPNRRSRKIEITIKEGAIEDYLNNSKTDRTLSDAVLKEHICDRFKHFNSDDDTGGAPYGSTERWLIPRHVFNVKPLQDSLSRNQEPSVYRS